MTTQRIIKKNLLLTGATGFLGSHLLEGFILCGDYKVICLKRSFSDTSRIEHLKTSDLSFFDLDKLPLINIFKK